MVELWRSVVIIVTCNAILNWTKEEVSARTPARQRLELADTSKRRKTRSKCVAIHALRSSYSSPSPPPWLQTLSRHLHICGVCGGGHLISSYIFIDTIRYYIIHIHHTLKISMILIAFCIRHGPFLLRNNHNHPAPCAPPYGPPRATISNPAGPATMNFDGHGLPWASEGFHVVWRPRLSIYFLLSIYWISIEYLLSIYWVSIEYLLGIYWASILPVSIEYLLRI